MVIMVFLPLVLVRGGIDEAEEVPVRIGEVMPDRYLPTLLQETGPLVT